MNRAFSSVLVIALLLVVSACVREIPRQEGTSPTATSEALVPTPTLTATATATQIVTPVHTATSTFTASPTASPTPTLPPTATATPSPSPTPTPTRTATPEPTSTPEPTATPEPAPLLSVQGPANGAIVQSDEVVVHGITESGVDLSVNGEPVDVDSSGRFRVAVGLSPGENEIVVIASKDGGIQAREELSITSVVLPPQPFFLLVTQPQDQSIVTQATIPIAGRTVPGAIVSVNGISVPIDGVGIFSTAIKLDPGPNIIDVLATSNDGEVLSAVIAIIYRP